MIGHLLAVACWVVPLGLLFAASWLLARNARREVARTDRLARQLLTVEDREVDR